MKMIRLFIERKCDRADSAHMLERVQQLECRVAQLEKMIENRADDGMIAQHGVYTDELNNGILLVDDYPSDTRRYIALQMIKNRKEHGVV